MTTALPLVVAITGASGAPYSVRLLQALAAAGQPSWLIVSEHGFRLLQTESGVGDLKALRDRVGAVAWDATVRVFDDRDRGALPASGSVQTKGMVICPCSMGTVAAIAMGTSRSLVERAADVVLKERRKLVVVPRETPYSDIHLENMLRLTRAGAIVLPASPGFYHRPESIEELVDFVVGRILDHVGVKNEMPRWSDSDSA
ncbi:MAG TPA: flavin prenyltransferase UbiX [Gemmatimonadaceae bacterium]|nr:flavin prenyltransferase UbiX [Gemmatimonadaceae bacterium]